MNILLVKPKARLGSILGLQGFQLLEPIELGYLAAAVPAHHHVQVLDLRLHRFPRHTLLRALRAVQPDLVAFTGYTHEASSVKILATMVREVLPEARVVVGGHHATVEPWDYLGSPCIDAVVRGEGCGPFGQIIGALEGGAHLDGIPNVLTRLSSDDQESWPQFPDPALLPTPRRDLWKADSYFSVWVQEKTENWQSLYPRVAMVRTSFGCRMKCSFCVVPHLFGGRHMPRPVEAVVDEIASLEADHVYFCDDENFINPQFAGELAEALAIRGVKKRYFAWARSTTVNRNPELLARWREIGLDGVFVGFEFSTDEELKDVQKGGNVGENERAHEILRSMGIAVHAAFMVQPEYGQGEFAQLRQYVQDMPPAQCSFTVCTPSPGTCDYQEIKSRIWVDNPFDLHDCMHPLTPTALPLREFCRLFAEQAAEGVAKTPLRASHHLPKPWDLARVFHAGNRYFKNFRDIYLDYPRHLWDVGRKGLH